MTSSPADRSVVRLLATLLPVAAVIVWGATPAVAQTFGPINTYHVWHGHPAFWDGNLTPSFGAQADFDGDGDLDTVISDASQPTTLRLMTNNGSGGFSPSPITVSGATNSNRIHAADMNADGKKDIIVSNNHSRNVSVLLNTGNAGGVATFTTVVNLPMHATNSGARGVAVGDLNNDGKLDVVGGDSDFLVYVFINTGNGTFSAPTYYSDGARNRLGIAIADLNNDGKNDVLVGNRDSGGPEGEFSVFLGNGTGGLTPLARVAGAKGDSFVTADFNRDGHIDVASSRGPNADAVAVYLGTGTGAFSAPSYFPTGAAGNFHVASADFDGDGKIDLVASNTDSHRLSILRGNGNGTFGAALTYPGATTGTFIGPNQVLTGDVNGDGKPDVSSIQSGSDNLAVMLNTSVQSDTTPPVITSAVSGTLGSGGWYTSNVTVAWTVTDEESSATASGCDTQTVTADTDSNGITFTCSATSLGGTTTESVTIKRDTTGPAISSATASPSVLWAPNNKMVAVTVSVSANDTASGNAVCIIDAVNSNEGGSMHEPDVEMTGPLTLNLRAEREGKGSGRVYTAAISCTDAAGNTSTATATVTVPHDQSKKK